MDAAYRQSVLYTRVYTYDGTILGATSVPTSYGLKITLPVMLYVDSLPPGQFYTVEISLPSAIWPDTTKFPCPQSYYEPGAPSCDYWVHGWQTYEGDIRKLKLDTATQQYAQCCPEGVVQFCKGQIGGSCNPRLTDSPWRLDFNRNATAGGLSTLFFDLHLVTPGPQLGIPDCSRMSVEEVKLYINPSQAPKLTGVFINQQSVPVVIKNDPMTYVSIPTLLPYGSPAQIMLQFNSVVSKFDLCTLTVGSYAVCDFKLNGAAGQCCTSGDVVVGLAEEMLSVFG
mmetsp:Transcript_6271/g.13772  ORF Transcript_6271/g.13772 Transcript_6271/m.13772 type:complete len:283 (-) Transcript_6271:620-1468(-)